MNIKLVSEMSLDECRNKLLSHMDTSFGAMFSLESFVVGHIKEDRVFMHKRTPFYANSFGRAFYGHLFKSGDHTVLEGKFKLYTPVKLLLIIMILIYLLILSLMVYGMITSPSVTSELILGMFLVIGFGVLGGCLYAFGRYRSYVEENYLIELLEAVFVNGGKEE